jgi:lysophospholipase L1-like esterase
VTPFASIARFRVRAPLSGVVSGVTPSIPIPTFPPMPPTRLLRPLFLTLGLLSVFGATAATALADASAAEPRYGNSRFFRFHADFLDRGRAGPVGLLFLGDSITHAWDRHPEIWEKAWGDYDPANFGHGGDQTQHIIWRISQGELDNIRPKVVVLLIGTNNIHHYDAPEIVTAQRKIVGMIHDKLPEAKVLLLAVFPRGPRINGRGEVEDHEQHMRKINAINAELATMDNGDSLRYLDLGPKFMSADGTIATAIMPDQLHLSAAGYEIWVEGMKPLVDEMMAESFATAKIEP